jgi:hypothetical protein
VKSGVSTRPPKKALGWKPRLWWGVVMTGSDKKQMLLGQTWDDYLATAIRASPVLGRGPVAPLMFTKRRDAREWCRGRLEFYAKYPDGHVCRYWHFAPVRVRESWAVSK